MKRKLRVGLLFGGKSGEHEVSLLSAKSIYEALDKSKYEVVLIGIDKKGHWLLGNSSNYLLNDTNPKLIKLNSQQSQSVTAIPATPEAKLVSSESRKDMGQIDVFFPITHGTYGEDGSLQGFLELLNATYVGAGVLGSAVGMDKDIMKRLLKINNIPSAKFISVKKHEATSITYNDVVKKLGSTVFVKPANLGSSVGVSKVKNESEFQKAVSSAFEYDTKILIEEAIAGREIECSVLGNDHPIASVPGEIIPSHEFYSYEAKYIDEHGAALEIPAKLDPNMVKKVQEMAIATFITLECSGMARVDFFLKKNGDLLVNEINTLPGFTKISMYPKLWEATGISYTQLLDRLIELAIEKKKQKDTLKRSYT